MFDFRYHVASLAAVFFALVIGILVGVALASHGLGNTERDRLQEDVKRAEARGDAYKTQVDALTQSGASDKAFVERAYQLVMANRLKGQKIAVLFVGSTDSNLSAVKDALTDADAGEPIRVRALTVPIDPAKLQRRLANRPFLAAFSGPKQLQQLGHALGQEFASGGDTPLLNALQSLIVEERAGRSKKRADGVVVVRTVAPQTGPTAVFLKGLYAGLNDVGVPAVGVEGSDDAASAMKAFQKAGLSTVDDIDTRAGKLALATLLSDPMTRGDFGVKKTATDGPLPNVSPVLTTTTGG
jgi:Copper transport outer membrane protein, MctB